MQKKVIIKTLTAVAFLKTWNTTFSYFILKYELKKKNSFNN